METEPPSSEGSLVAKGRRSTDTASEPDRSTIESRRGVEDRPPSAATSSRRRGTAVLRVVDESFVPDAEPFHHRLPDLSVRDDERLIEMDIFGEVLILTPEGRPPLLDSTREVIRDHLKGRHASILDMPEWTEVAFRVASLGPQTEQMVESFGAALVKFLGLPPDTRFRTRACHLEQDIELLPPQLQSLLIGMRKHHPHKPR